MVRAYCHRVIKLSDALQSFATEKETTSNVHGVRYNFIEEGKRRAQMLRNNEPWNQGVDSSPQIYFIGKLLWAKGLDLMIEMEDYFKQYTGQYFPIDVFGTGPDQRAIMRAFHGRRNSINKTPKEEALIEAEDDDDDIENYVLANSTDNNGKDESLASSAKRLHVKAKEKIAKLKETINSVELPQSFSELRRQPIPASFPGRVDHGILRDHKIFVNPSISEVLCTTTAEALAMNKFVIIPLHPSNTFFLQFPNCLAYRNKFEFVASLRWALTHDPEPLTEEQARMFTWEAATERLVAASAITWREALERERLGLAKLDERIAWFHNELGKGATGDMLRKVLGAGPASHQVKYQKALATKYNESEYEEGEESESEEDESGFSKKFQSSSFAQAIRATLGDISAFGIQ
jgi:digalactosyldiacylglycerol synthase